MVSHKLSLIVIFITLFLNANSQTGPGGVGSNDGTSDLIMWYRPDNLISTTGALIDNWSNSAGISDFDLSATTTLRPTLVTGAINGYNEINFDGSNRLQTSTTLTTTNFLSNQASSLVVTKAGNTTQRTSLYRVDGDNNTRFLCHIPWSGNVYFDIGTCCSTNTRIEINNVSSLLDYSIWSYDAHPTTGKQLYRNETLLQNRANTLTFIPNSSSIFYLGHGGFIGDITEVAIFKTKINQAQRIIIDNYLSAKYDQSLANNDFYIQDNSGNGNFDHDVAGIGQANDGTNQTDSQGTGIIRVNTPSLLSNNDYLFWGEETKDPTYNFSTNATGGYYEQLNSKWRVSKRNDLGSVTVTFDLTNVDLTGKQSCQALQLVVDNDSDFSSPTAYNLTTAGTANNVIFNDGDYFTLRYLDQIVLDGSNFFNGSGINNAPDNTDVCLKLTVKNGATGTLTFDAHVREIEVETNGIINVSDNVLLEVEDAVVINGTIDLLGESQLIQNHLSTTNNSGTGFLIKRQQGASNLYNYNYWSSPVNRSNNWQIGYLEDANGIVTFNGAINADATTVPITLSNYWLYSYNGLSSTYSLWNKLTPTSPLTPAIGYTMKGSGASGTDQEYIFKGIPNDGDYIIPITSGDDILVGNPYPSALNADQFLTDNATGSSPSIDGALYFWEHFATNNSHYLADYEGGYAIRNLMMGTAATADGSGLTSGTGLTSKPTPEQYIPVGQGFFVTASASGGDIIFNNGQRFFARESLGESIYYKNKTKKTTTNKDERTKIWFSFTEPANRIKQFGLGYDSKASKDYDNGYDAKTYDDLRNDANWILDDKLLAIQSLSDIDINDELHLKIKITDAGIYKFAIDKMQYVPDYLEVYLKDNEQNIYYNLKNQTAEIFLDASSNENQFSIVFQKSNVLSINEIDNNSIYLSYNQNTKTLELHNLENAIIDKLKIFNTLGQDVITFKTPKSKTFNIESLSDGVYLLKTTLKNGLITKTIKFIKH